MLLSTPMMLSTPILLLVLPTLLLPVHDCHNLPQDIDSDYDSVLDSPDFDPAVDMRCNVDNKNCRVSGDSLDSVLQMFFCRSEMFCSSTTELDKKIFLAENISPYIDLGLEELTQMDSCRLVPLVNLVMYHRNNGEEMGKENTTEQWRNLIITQVSTSPIAMLMNWNNVSGLVVANLLDKLDNFMLVSLGCAIENVKTIQKQVRLLGRLTGTAFIEEEDETKREGRTTDWVNCGAHQAASCQYCPQGNGAAWCNGECYWSSGSCEQCPC